MRRVREGGRGYFGRGGDLRRTLEEEKHEDEQPGEKEKRTKHDDDCGTTVMMMWGERRKEREGESRGEGRRVQTSGTSTVMSERSP